MKKYLAILLSGLFLFQSRVSFGQSAAADSLLDFIQEHPSQASLCLRQNDTVIAHLNENRMMPLASTVKILVAIEFAKQASYHLIDPLQRVALSAPGRYYIPHTDGNAHPSWISYEKKLGNIVDDSISLIEVAKGMILFSSNANTEYLMDVLGIDNINSNMRLLGITDHTPLYPFVSALFLYQNPRGIKENKIIKQIGKFTDAQYAEASLMIHNQLKRDTLYKKNFRPQDLTPAMQKVWSDRLPASTTSSYCRIAGVLNNRTLFDSKTYDILSRILETLMGNPANQSWLVHAGKKGGATQSVLTKVLYGTLKNGTRIEMAYFFNGISAADNLRLQGLMNSFELECLSNVAFRRKVAASLN